MILFISFLSPFASLFPLIFLPSSRAFHSSNVRFFFDFIQFTLRRLLNFLKIIFQPTIFFFLFLHFFFFFFACLKILKQASLLILWLKFYFPLSSRTSVVFYNLFSLPNLNACTSSSSIFFFFSLLSFARVKSLQRKFSILFLTNYDHIFMNISFFSVPLPLAPIFYPNASRDNRLASSSPLFWHQSPRRYRANKIGQKSPASVPLNVTRSNIHYQTMETRADKVPEIEQAPATPVSNEDAVCSFILPPFINCHRWKKTSFSFFVTDLLFK